MWKYLRRKKKKEALLEEIEERQSLKKQITATEQDDLFYNRTITISQKRHH